MTRLHACDHDQDRDRDQMHSPDADVPRLISRPTASSRFGASSRRGATDDEVSVAVMTPSLDWPMMSPMLSGISHVLEQSSRELALYSIARKHERTEFIARMAATRQLEGLIAIYPDGAASLDEATETDRRISLQLSQIHEQGLPVAIIDDQTPHEGVPWVSADNRQGAMDAVRHLIRLGHRRIAHISGPRAYLCAQDRLAGYRSALAEAHLPLDHALEIRGDFTAASGWAGAIYLLTLPEPPTAIFAANDDIARGVLTAVQQHGLLVPWQVAVVGFDDAGATWSAEPPLTSARQPFYDMGWWAATRISDQLATRAARRARRMSPLARERADRTGHVTLELPEHVELPVTLMQRESSGPRSELRLDVESALVAATP